MSYETYSTQSINHWLRKDLGLSCDEYCLLLYIYDYCKAKKLKKLIWNKYMREHIKKNLCFSIDQQIQLLRSLIDKGYFSRTTAKNRFIRNPQSITPFAPNKEKFEQMWEFYGKIGNKQMALEAYEKTIREYSYDFLMARIEAYHEHLKIVDQSQLHLSTFLNPNKKRFLDEYKKKKKQNHVKGNFFE